MGLGQLWPLPAERGRLLKLSVSSQSALRGWPEADVETLNVEINAVTVGLVEAQRFDPIRSPSDLAHFSSLDITAYQHALGGR